MKEMKTLNGYEIVDEKARALCNEVVYTKCSELGLTANDSDSQNIVKLANAINSGARILVDGFYVLKGNTVNIDSDVILKGADPESGFNYQGDKVVFNISKNVRYIDLYYLSFVREGASEAVLLSNTSNGENDLDIEKFPVRNCTFTGNFMLFRQTGNRLYNNSSSLSTVKEFVFSHNKVSNVAGTFCNLANVCFTNAELTNNRITNFKFVAFHFGTENLPTNPTAEQQAKYDRLTANKGKVFVDNNYVVCEDEWILDANPLNNSYYYFVLAECRAVIYNNNHVEGLKASIDISIGDIYASAENVETRNNVWKNNICFHASKTLNYLMKAKQGDGVKVFQGNTYLVTEEFLTMLQNTYSADRANCWVSLLQATDASMWDVTENNIHIASALKFFQANQTAQKLNVSNNVFVADKLIESTLVSKGMNAEVQYVNNVIRSDNYDGLMTLVGVMQPGGSCVIKNNTIITPKAKWAGIMSGNERDKTWSVRGNRFDVYRARYFGFADFADNEIKASDCSYIACGSTVDAEQRFTVDFSTFETGAPVRIIFGAEKSVTLLKVMQISKTNSRCHAADVTIETYYDNSTQKIKITNNTNSEVLHDDIMHPETTVNLPLLNYALRLILRSGDSEIQNGNNAKSILYVERKTVICE